MQKLIDPQVFVVWPIVMFFAVGIANLFTFCIPRYVSFRPCFGEHFWGWLTFTTVVSFVALMFGQCSAKLENSTGGKFAIVLGALWMAIATGQVFGFPTYTHDGSNFEYTLSFVALSLTPFIRNRFLFWMSMFVVATILTRDLALWGARYSL